MKVAITFEVDTDARLAIERLYDSKSGKPASYDRVRGWMVATLRSTLEEVEADASVAEEAREMADRFAREDGREP